MSKTLKSFQLKQAEEEGKQTENVKPESAKTKPADDDTDEDDDDDEEEEEKPAPAKKKKAKAAEASETPKGKSASVGKQITLAAGQEVIASDELKTLRADASAWNKNKGTFATLQDWHKSMKGVGAGAAEEDTSNLNDDSGSKVSTRSWNQKAQKAYGTGPKKKS